MSDITPQLSVVVATRNRPEFLREAVAAIAAQEGIDGLEIIVVHDQSDLDESIAEAAPWATVRVVSNTREVGLAGARNTGVMLAAGEYVAFCDDDDVWLPGKAAWQIAVLRARPEAGLVTTGIIVDYDGQEHHRSLPMVSITLADMLRDRRAELHPSTFLFRTQALRDWGLVSPEVPGGFGEDYELLLRVARHGVIANIPNPLVRVRWHKSSYFFERWRMMAEGLSYVLAEYPEFRTDRRGYARIRGQIAFAHAAGGDRKEGVVSALRAASAYPLEMRALLALLVAARLAKPEWIMAKLHTFGRGI